MDKDAKKSFVQLAYASSVGIAMVLMVFGGLYFGAYLDGKFGTGPYLTLIFLILGIAAGFRNVYVLIKRYFADDQPLITGLRNEPHPKRPAPKKA
jgi:ATP synthase protein I